MCGGKNALFLDDVRQSEVLRGYIFYGVIFSEQKCNANIDVDPDFSTLYSYVLDRVILSLQKGSFDEAYDIIDVFHWIPEAIVKERKIDDVDFCSSMNERMNRWSSFLKDLPSCPAFISGG